MTQRFDPDAFSPIDGYTLERYAAVCRALVRVPAASARQRKAALEEHALTADQWTAIQAGWAERIAADPFVRGAFRRLYVGEPASADSMPTRASTEEGA